MGLNKRMALDGHISIRSSHLSAWDKHVVPTVNQTATQDVISSEEGLIGQGQLEVTVPSSDRGPVSRPL